MAKPPPPRSDGRWGWHQLDPRWAARLVTEAGLPPGALVLDIGAGTGVITAALIEAGQRVIAVEAHPDRARDLRARFAGAVTVVQADAADLRLPRTPFHVVANPPFAVTSPLLRRLLHPRSRLVSATVVLQRQAAHRWLGRAGPNFVGRLGPPVPRRAFTPPPKVDAAVLHLDRRSIGRQLSR